MDEIYSGINQNKLLSVLVSKFTIKWECEMSFLHYLSKFLYYP
jgi:hypothetical protein